MADSDLKLMIGGVVVGAATTLALQRLFGRENKCCSGNDTQGEVGLHYWNGRGLMEVGRMLMALGGKFPGEGYTDHRYTTDPPKGVEESLDDIKDKCAANLGRLPIVTIGGDSIGQSGAIYYYLASENGLMGSSTLETAKIIEIYEGLNEMKTAFRKNGPPYGKDATDEQLDKWFEGGASDTSPAGADMKKREERFFKWFAGRIEYRLGSNGFAVGNKRSLADVLLYNSFAETLLDFEAAEKVAKQSRQPFNSAERTKKALQSYPKLKAVVESVAAEPNLIKWFKTRSTPGGVQNLQRF